MDYATQEPIPTQKKPKRAAAAHAARGVQPLHAASQGCRRSTTGQDAHRSCGTAADGFLRAVFPTVLKEEKQPRTAAQKEAVTQGFYTSLAQLAAHYGITVDLSTARHYPEGIAKTLAQVTQALKGNTTFHYDLRLVHDTQKVFLTTEERYNTGSNLYYIPIIPLYKMLRHKSFRKAALLLLSVCSWLYRSVGVPYYRQHFSYLYWQYEMIWEWAAQDEDDDYTKESIAELDTAALIGDLMQQKLENPANITCLAARLECFVPLSPMEKECQEVALLTRDTLLLYPDAYVQRNLPAQQETEAGEDDETIRMDKYLGFTATTEGWLFDTLSEMVNNEFNECGQVEEPTVVKHFDGRPVTASLDFECRVFDIINRLCDILYEYKME